jgi:hypothetical protein
VTRASILVAGFTALVISTGIAAADPAGQDQDAAEDAGQHEHWRQEICTEHFARLSARIAYLEVKLGLTADQRPLWDKWRAAVADGAGKVRDACLAEAKAPDGQPTIVDRLARLQVPLATQAAALQAAQPPLAALYQSLTPEQRDLVERAMKMSGGHHHHGWGRHGWDHRQGEGDDRPGRGDPDGWGRGHHHDGDREQHDDERDDRGHDRD